MANGSIPHVVARDIGLSIGVPLEVDAAGVGMGGESGEEGEGAKEGEDRPRS